MNADGRYELKQQLNAQRTEDYRNGSYALAGGVSDSIPADAPQFVKDYYAYYKTQRGYHKRSLNSNGGWNKTSSLSFINMPILSYAGAVSCILPTHLTILNTHAPYPHLRNQFPFPYSRTPQCLPVRIREISFPHIFESYCFAIQMISTIFVA